MSGDDYLRGILAREAVDTGPSSPALKVRTSLLPVIQQWAGTALVDVSPSGSFAKGTANHSGTDIDLFISLSSNVTVTLKDIYETLFTAVTQAGFNPKRQNVSINIRVNGLDVDLVPAKRQDTYSQDHSLYRRRANTWTKTNVTTHVNYVRSGGRLSETRVLKLWRNQKGLDFPSFYLEIATIEALRGKAGTLSDMVWQTFAYLRDTFPSARLVDPANTNNVISDDLTDAERGKIKTAASNALAAKFWSEIVR